MLTTAAPAVVGLLAAGRRGLLRANSVGGRDEVGAFGAACQPTYMEASGPCGATHHLEIHPLTGEYTLTRDAQEL